MKEFIAMMAFLMALLSLTIDAPLPAFTHMAADLSVMRINDIQYVVGAVFLGMTLGTLVYGPLSDTYGRKPSLFLGLGLFLAGSVIALFATSLPVMLAGRFIQGLGVGAPRILTMAMVRDKCHGRQMASLMSLVMGFFILFPALAPAIGQGIMHLAGWRAIFAMYVVFALFIGAWAYFRLDETWPLDRRRPLQLSALWAGLKEAVSTRVTLGYTLASGFLFGTLLTYINSAQQIYQDVFEAGERFPLYFGILAMFTAIAFFTNSRLVTRFGMRKITFHALLGAITCAYIFLALVATGHASLPPFMVVMAGMLFCLGLTFGNMGAMALDPLGHIAGLASAYMGAFSTIISLTLGGFFGQMYNGTLWPLACAYACLTTGGLLVVLWTEKGIPHAHAENETR